MLIDNFRADLEKAGYCFKEPILADDHWHRCYFGDEKKSSGRYRLKIVDERFSIGNYGSDKDPEGFRSWHNKIGTKNYSPEERATYRQKAEAEKKALEAERERKQDRLARRLEKLYHRLPEANTSQEYLYKKQIGTHGVKVRRNKFGQEELIVPIYMMDSRIWNLQRICPKWKGYCKGAKVLGGFFPFGDSVTDTVILCEGFATGASTYQATDFPVYAALSTANLEPLARILKAHYPQAQIIFAGDNDQFTTDTKGDPYNTGLVKSRAAAAAIGGAKVIWPEFQDVSTKPTDFNDLHVLEGLEAVKARISEALTPPREPEPEPIPFDTEPHRDSHESPWPFQVLGFNDGAYYFLPNSTYQVVELSAPAVSNIANLCRLATLDFWRHNFGGEKLSTRKIAEYAMAALTTQAHEKGMFDSTKMRGVGAWLDKDRVVIHAGEELVVDGARVPMQGMKSKYVYPARLKSFPCGGEALSTKEAVKLREICAKLSWENKLSGELLAGWIVIAPVCGALDWRPHIWIEGESESGKTTIIEKIITPLMAGAAMRFDGGTTEAAIRQLLGIDALPIIYDEAEPENVKDRMIMDGLLLLARRSSKGGVVGKGGSGGKGESFTMRSCFCFAGINPAIKQRADESRISRLAIRKANFEDNESFFRDLKKEITATFTKEYAAGLLARTIKLLPIIIKNAEIFTDAVAEELSNRRAADQIGVMLAGLYSLTSPKAVTFDTAVEFVKKHQWTQHTAIEESKDYERLISHLTTSKVRYKNHERFIGELIEMAWKDLRHKNLDPDPGAEKFLRYIGIWPRNDGIWIINKSARLEDIFRGTPWETNWSGQLRNIPGAMASVPNYFAIGMTGRSICVPYSAFNIEDTV